MTEQHPCYARPLLAPTMGQPGPAWIQCDEQGCCDLGEDISN